jgi:hypothetical protein
MVQTNNPSQLFCCCCLAAAARRRHFFAVGLRWALLLRCFLPRPSADPALLIAGLARPPAAADVS